MAEHVQSIKEFIRRYIFITLQFFAILHYINRIIKLIHKRLNHFVIKYIFSEMLTFSLAATWEKCIEVLSIWMELLFISSCSFQSQLSGKVVHFNLLRIELEQPAIKLGILGEIDFYDLTERF